MRVRTIALSLLLLAWLSGAVEGGEPEIVTFPTADRLTITGDFWATGRPGGPSVVALHMYPADRTSWRPVAEIFQKKGINFLAIDMRGYGDSAKQRGKDLAEKVQARDERHFSSMHKDALAAYAFLVERGADPDRVAFLGASVGCSVAIDAAAREPRIQGVAVLTPGEKYLGIETMDHLKDYGARPMLILSSVEEADVGATAIKEAVGNSAECLLMEETGIHGTKMFGVVAGLEEWIVAWLGHLLGAGVHLDGDVTPAEDNFQFGDWDMMENGRGRPVLKALGGWLYAGIKLEEGGPAPERFYVAWARDGDPGQARRIACEFDERGARFTFEALVGGRWKPVADVLPEGARLGVSTEKGIEVMIPRRLEGLSGEGDLKVAFGLARKAGDHLSALPLNDDSLTAVERWLDFGLSK